MISILIIILILIALIYAFYYSTQISLSISSELTRFTTQVILDFNKNASLLSESLDKIKVLEEKLNDHRSVINSQTERINIIQESLILLTNDNRNLRRKILRLTPVSNYNKEDSDDSYAYGNEFKDPLDYDPCTDCGVRHHDDDDCFEEVEQ